MTLEIALRAVVEAWGRRAEGDIRQTPCMLCVRHQRDCVECPALELFEPDGISNVAAPCRHSDRWLEAIWDEDYDRAREIAGEIATAAAFLAAVYEVEL